MRLPHNCLVLVADGRKMLLMRNNGMADDLRLIVEHGEEQPNPADQNQKTDARGQKPSGGKRGQSSTEEADYHQLTEDRFAARIAQHLNALALRNALDPIIVIASGKTLGELRRHFHREVQAKIIAEIDKVMTGYSSDRIAQMLMGREERV